MSHNLHSRLFHLVIYGYIFLGAAEEFVPNKLHDHLGRDAAVRELGDKSPPPAVARRALDASLAVQLSEQLAERLPLPWDTTRELTLNQRGMVQK